MPRFQGEPVVKGPRFGGQAVARPVEQPADPLANYNPPQDMSTLERFAAGMGKGMTDLGYGAGQVLGLVDQDTIREKQRIDSALADTTAGKVGDVAGKILTAAPAAFVPGANTAVGASLIGGGLGLAEPVAEGDVLTGKAKNTAVGAALGLAGHKVGKAIGDKVGQASRARSARKASEQAARSVQDESLKAGRQLGYTVNPTQANPTRMNQILEGTAGKLSTAQRAGEMNQQVTNQVARRALGMADDTPLTPESLGAVRRNAYQAYEAIKSLPSKVKADRQYVSDLNSVRAANRKLAQEFPAMANDKLDDLAKSFAKREFSYDSAVEAVKQLRHDAGTLFRSDDPAKVAMARANRQVADAIEKVLDRNLQKAGNPDLYNNFVNARQLIAKTHTVENALNPGTGNVIARKLAAELQKGKPLSGELKQAAQFASAFPKATQEITSSMPGISPLDVYAAGGLSAATGNPAALGSLFIRPGVRNAILSKPYQNLMTQPSYGNKMGELARLLAENPRLQAMSAATAPSIYAAQ